MNKPVRRSQAISPFGIGAMVDFPGPISLIHAGLDAWPFDPLNPDHREFIEEETRLAKRLGVEYFVQPPDYRRNEYRNTDRGTDATRLNLNLKLPFLCGITLFISLNFKTSPILGVLMLIPIF